MPAQERFLALHHHPEQLTRKEENLVTGAKSASQECQP